MSYLIKVFILERRGRGRPRGSRARVGNIALPGKLKLL